jgi:hypothetical protein
MAAPVKTEVQTLLSRLEASGCEFNRNGSWHSPAEARSHLQMKLDYIVERAELHSAEEFIDMAATQSSWSGRPYLVRCSKAEPMPSATWMRQQLLRLREDSRPQNGANAAR